MPQQPAVAQNDQFLVKKKHLFCNWTVLNAAKHAQHVNNSQGLMHQQKAIVVKVKRYQREREDFGYNIPGTKITFSGDFACSINQFYECL